MRHFKPFARGVACLAALVAMTAVLPRTADAQNADPTKESELIGILQSDAPGAEKAITCKKLAIHGTKEAVPALAALLADEQLTSWARIALEAIPGPEADEALRKSMESVKGRILIGVINSIAVRRDANAVDALAERLNDQDAEVAAAAAVALGKVGNEQAAKTLRQALAEGRATAGAAEGCILCAERLLAEGKADEAAAIYDEVRKAQVPKPRILEATRGAILARQAEGLPLLVEQLRSDDRGLFRIGLIAARELAASGVVDALATEAIQATPQRGALMLTALADREDAVASPAVLKIAKSGAKPLRIAAIGVLQRLEDPACVPTLLEIAIEDDAELTEGAKTALASLSGEKVDAEIAARLTDAQGKMLPILIELVGRRRINAVAPLLKAVDHPEAGVRHAALMALGATVGPDDLSVLITRVTSPKKPEDAKPAQAALREACVRMPQREATAAQLVAAMPRASSSAQLVILETLGAVSGSKALAAIGKAAKGGDPQLQDAGSRLLGEWMTVDAAPVLLDLATTAPEQKYQIRALRGFIRLARQFSMPDQQRAAMCRDALQIAKRTAEQKLVLQVMERYPSIDMLQVATKAAETPALKEDATRVSLVIAQKLGGKNLDARKLLLQIGQDPVKVEIVKAEYGAGSNQKDVTEALRKQVRDLPLIVLASPSYNASFGGDPAPGTVKQLKIQYRIDGKAGEATFAEDEIIMLPKPK